MSGTHSREESDRRRKSVGAEGERMAAELLIARGYTIRERNWKPKNSNLEVDIIAQCDNVIVFVEVKTRTQTDILDPAEAVTPAKIRKLVAAANRYMSLLEADYEYRFDVITVSGEGPDAEIDHLPDAFYPPLTTR